MIQDPHVLVPEPSALRPALGKEPRPSGHGAWLRPAAWAFLLVTGLIQTWHMRHLVFSDGVSYLDIADHYVRGDWKNALNNYWSPLYPWVLALAFKSVKPSPYWQTAVLHAVNYIMFAAALGTLELFLASYSGCGAACGRPGACCRRPRCGWPPTCRCCGPDFI